MRGHTLETLARFKVGLADGDFCRYAQEELFFTNDELVESGLMSEEYLTDYWRPGLLLFPHLRDGNVSHFSQIIHSVRQGIRLAREASQVVYRTIAIDKRMREAKAACSPNFPPPVRTH